MKKNLVNTFVVFSTILMLLLAGCGGPPQPVQNQPPAPAKTSSSIAKFSNTQPAVMNNVNMYQITTDTGVEYVNSTKYTPNMVVKKADPLTIIGWAINSSAKSVPATVVVALTSSDGKKYFAEGKRNARPDVAQYFKNQAYENAGYTVTASISDLVPGQYSMAIIQIDNTGAFAFSKDLTLSVQ